MATGSTLLICINTSKPTLSVLSFPDFYSMTVVSTVSWLYLSRCSSSRKSERGRRGLDQMVVGFTTTYAISAYHLWWCEFKSWSGRGVQHKCDKVCQWLATGQCFFPGPLVFSTNKTDCHDITKILLKVALNTIKQTNKHKSGSHDIADKLLKVIINTNNPDQ